MLENKKKGSLRWQAFGVLALFSVWVIAPTDGYIIPDLMKVLAVAQRLLVTGELPLDLLQSLKRVLLGLGVAIVMAGIACAVGLSTIARNIMQGPFEVLRPIPPIAWIPVVILLLGAGGAASVAIVAIAAFFPIVTSVFAAWDTMDEKYLQMARTLGVGRWEMLPKIYVPLLIEGFLIGLRLAVGLAWFSVVASEMVGSSSGLGHAIQISSLNLEMEKFFAYFIAIALCGLTMNWMVIWLFYLVCPWRHAG